MMRKQIILAASFAICTGSAILAVAQEKREAASAAAARPAQQNQQASASTNWTSTAPASASASSASSPDARAMRIEGEKRFHTNCGRCHVAPHKFPPRAMATIVRHMRVRATITDDDMRFILAYLTQ